MSQHRPRFDRWESKFVKRLAKVGQSDLVFKLLK